MILRRLYIIRNADKYCLYFTITMRDSLPWRRNTLIIL